MGKDKDRKTCGKQYAKTGDEDLKKCNKINLFLTKVVREVYFH